MLITKNRDVLPETFNSHLSSALKQLSTEPCPHVPTPKDIKKRASVALILRIQPNPLHWPSADTSRDQNSSAEAPVEQWIENFFSQTWVQKGESQALFIKRAARVGDRWTSHVALPGGKRDPDDESDRAAAVREVLEEVGITLNSSNSIYVGNLPERVVKTSWGTIP
jgi:NUDIX domain